MTRWTSDWRPALRKEILPKPARWRGIGYGLMDLLVIAACCVVFVAVIGAAKSKDPKGPPTALITRDPGTSAQGPQAPLPQDHKKLVATALDIFANRPASVIE
jgi:hypothetical protein